MTTSFDVNMPPTLFISRRLSDALCLTLAQISHIFATEKRIGLWIQHA